MHRDPTEFRRRFAAWKDGKKPYENGRISDELYVETMEDEADTPYLPKFAPGHDVGGFSKEIKRRIDLLYKRLRQKGFDDISAAGIIGNAIQESSLNSDSVNLLGYSGLWLNSKAIRKAIEEQYGDYSYDSQLRYLDDWVSGNTWIRKGKHAKHTSTYSGSFKRTGYANATEAADQFLKRYERAVVVKDNKIVRDKYGNPVYQDRDKRLDYANKVYSYLTGNPYTPIIKPATQTTAAEFHAANKPPLYIPPKLIQAEPDYSLTNSAPPMISSWNNPTSPSNVNIIPRITSMSLQDDSYLPNIMEVFKQYYGDDNKHFRTGKLPKYGDGTKYVQAGKDNSWSRISNDDMSAAFQNIVARPKSRGGNTTVGNWNRQWSLKGEPGLEIVSPEFEILSLGGGIKQMYDAYRHIPGLKIRPLNLSPNSWIYMPKRQPYNKYPYSVSWDDFIIEPKVGKYFDEGGEAIVHEAKNNPGFLVKLKSELGEGKTLEDLEFMVNRDLHINDLPGTEPIIYKGFSVSSNPLRILDKVSGKPKTILNERFYPIYEQRKLTPYHKVNTDAFKVDQEMLVNDWAAKHGYEYLPNGWLKYGNISVSDQGFNNFAFDAFGNMKFIDPMIQTF